MNKVKLGLWGVGLSLALALAPRIASANYITPITATCSGVNLTYYDFPSSGIPVTLAMTVDGTSQPGATPTFSNSGSTTATEKTFFYAYSSALTGGPHAIHLTANWVFNSSPESATYNTTLTCPAAPNLDYFGRAFGVYATATLLNLQSVLVNAINDTGSVQGTNPQDVIVNVAQLNGLVTANVLHGEVKTGGGSVTTTESIATASVALGNVGIVVGNPSGPGLNAITAITHTSCGVTPATTTSTVNLTIAALTVGGIKVVGPAGSGAIITTAIKPNTTLTILGIQIILNEQIPIVIGGETMGVAVNAIRVIGTNILGLSSLGLGTQVSIAIGHAESFISGC